MPFKHHVAQYQLGNGELRPEQRIVVGTRRGPKEPRRLAEHLGLSRQQPKTLITHRNWPNGEYLPTFMTKECLPSKDGLREARADLFRYVPNYEKEGKQVWGEGLRGRTVYIVHTLSNSLSVQELEKRVEFIARTAKYNGAEHVSLIAYTLGHSAQERGSHETENERMQTEKDKEKFDGQAVISRLQLQLYATAGVDTIITPQNHCPKETQSLCDDVNEEFIPMQIQSREINSTLRYHLDFVHVDLAPMLGYFISDYGGSHLGFDLSNSGENVLFLCVDNGIYQDGFVQRARQHSRLHNAALAVLNKKRTEDGSKIDIIELVHTEGLTEERGIEGMYVFGPDDEIRSGETMRKVFEVFRGQTLEGLVRDPKIRGTPARIAAYAARTNFAGNSVDILSSPAIDDVVITNSDPRGLRNIGELDRKLQMLWINFMMAEAAKANERGEDPSSILTPDYIREHDLLRVEVPHGHERFIRNGRKSGII
ncbi:MAG: hypothetical protein CMH61_00940 [Nanoarchaeota archaeon]|nr:hypothetical protein [Nanoarchaeota archaeon]|tara:strand:+ start:707 stop:2152 length:1446 start_codon:yes stop_codon:yes gene_type:complete